MNVAILHFHLRRGGVTSVLRQQAACLAAQPGFSTAVIAGTPPETPLPAPVQVVPELDYDTFTGLGSGSEGEAALAAGIEAALEAAFPDGCDLLHVHNPLLRKNARLLGALRRLQARGQRLLIQEHDFAEDFRPHVFDPSPYPEGCDYAVINPRDKRHLVASGLEAGQVHYLPNPVSDAVFDPRGASAEEAERGRRTALYPVRAIRRKNIGEAVLLSRFLPEGARLAVTLPPTSGIDGPAYEGWKRLAAAWGDRIAFDAGLAAPLDDLYASSFLTVTTSVKEGFGYSYLDPLVRGVPVVGRALPAALEIFAEAGIGFEGLYSEIRIPREAVDAPALLAAAEERLSALRGSFAGAGWDAIESRLRSRFAEATVDFGALDEPAQAAVLERFADSGFVHELAALSPVLGSLFETRRSEADALALREAVLTAFSEQEYGRRLAAVCQMAARPGSGSVDKAKLAEVFLQPGAFFLAAS